MKKAIILFLIFTLVLTSAGFAFADERINPVFYLTFETLESGKISNFAGTGSELTLNNVKHVEGYRGVGASIDKKGYLYSETGKIARFLSGAGGVSLSAYIKNGAESDGNIFTVYNNGKNAGLKLIKSGSVIKFSVSSDKNELLKTVELDTKESFSDWTHILAVADFDGKKIEIFVNGESRLTSKIDFMSDSFGYWAASDNDVIGEAGLNLDEVRVHAAALSAAQAADLMQQDKNAPDEKGYEDILKDNLVAYFPFDEGEGDVVRSSGKASVTGKAVSELDWTEGVKGAAVMFHADSKNYINIGKDVSKALVGKGGLTVTGWFYLNHESGSGYQNRALSLNIDGERAMFHWTMNSGKVILCAARSDPQGPLTGLNYKPADADYEFGKWNHVTMTTDLEAKTMRLFLNGVEQTAMQNGGAINTNYSQSTFALADDANDDTIGGDPTNMSYTMTFNGAIDELKIYDRAISPEEAEYIYIENKNGSVMSRDSDNYAVLRELTKDSVFMAIGFNEVFAGETRERIDWDNFDAAPVLCGSTTMVPTKLAEDLLGAKVIVDLENKTAQISGVAGTMQFTADSKEYSFGGAVNTLNDAPYIDGETMYIPLRQVAELLGKAIYYNNCGLVAVGSNETVKKLKNDEEYALWMHDALTNISYQQSTADHYATRKVIDKIPDNSKVYYSSPSIAKLDDGALVASHDQVGGGTTILRSDDNGETWQKTHYEEYIVYANLFVNKGSLYLMGVRRGTGENAAVAVYRSDDGGYTWSVPKDNKTGWIVEDDGTSLVMPAHTAPTPVVRKDGRIYRAFDVSGASWRYFKVVVMSADENADLLDRSSWTITNALQLNSFADKFPEGSTCTDPGMCEANAVIGPDGGIYVLARFNSAPSVDLAAVLKLVDDETLEFDRIIDFPGGMTKFLVRYDEVSGKWIAFSNPNAQPDYTLQRTVLSMLVSDDMYNWKVAETLIVPPWLENWEILTKDIGFQYPDWIFDGDDILYVVRESDLYADNYHNSNYQTFYKLSDFRNYID